MIYKDKCQRFLLILDISNYIIDLSIHIIYNHIRRGNHRLRRLVCSGSLNTFKENRCSPKLDGFSFYFFLLFLLTASKMPKIKVATKLPKLSISAIASATDKTVLLSQNDSFCIGITTNLFPENQTAIYSIALFYFNISLYIFLHILWFTENVDFL